jgi:prepilin-type processing-associated H-X9-DG protein
MIRGSSAAVILPNWTLFKFTIGELLIVAGLVDGLKQLNALKASARASIRWLPNQRGLGNNPANGTNDNTGANVPLSSTHSGGVNCCFADGTVRFVTNSVTLANLKAMAGRMDGATVTLPD